MEKKYLVMALVPALMAAGWLGWYCSDKQVIRRRLSELAQDLGKEGRESAMETGLRMRDVRLLLAADCLVRIPETGYEESLENELIIQYLLYYRDRYERIRVSFDAMQVDIPAEDRAEVQVLVTLLKQESPQTEPLQVTAPVELGLKKQEKDWLLDQALVPEALVD